jgi:Tol biopolymer transport system component
LTTVQAARRTLTRRDWLKLGAAGTAACALPTLHLASAGGPDDPKVADQGKIYVRANFKLGGGENDGIFVVDPETSNWTKITEFKSGNVRVSRDGRMLALIDYGQDGGVWTLDATGQGERTKVADFGGVTTWSGDGKQLIVAKWLSKPQDETSSSENWRFNADGSDATKLPIPDTEEVDDWSPNGQWLVTVSDRHEPHGSGYQLYVMHPDGTAEHRLTQGKGLNVYPRFSPDSRKVAYLHQERGKNSLWVVNIDGTARSLVVEEENDTSPEQFAWSPDGKSLVSKLEDWKRDENGKKFIDNPEDANQRLAIIDVDGKNSRPLALPPARWVGAPDWR